MTIAGPIGTVRFLNAITVCLIVMAGSTAAVAQTNAFTYQGRLTDAGAAANGLFDFEFRLFDTATAGTQIGSRVFLDNVVVTNGVFNVVLDFGPGMFPGASRFLEIAVRAGTSTGGFTHLLPLQQITSTPYAIRSERAGIADTVTVAAISGGSTNYIQNGTAQQTGNFTISGIGTAAAFNYLTAQTGYFAVNEAAFTARDGVSVSKSTQNGGVYPTSTSVSGLVAPINLPHGATITNVRFIYIDNSTNNLLLVVYAHSLSASGGYNTLAAHTTSVQTSAVQTVDVPANPGSVVDNSTRSFEVIAFPVFTWNSSSMQVRGVVITYTPATACAMIASQRTGPQR